VGKKIFLKEEQVASLGMRELGVKTAGLGLHNREAQFPNLVGQLNIHNNSMVIA